MVANGYTNGTHKSRTPLRDGIYAPTMTFFDPETEDVDVPAIKRHAVRLAEAGLVGLVALGSNGEAVHLTREEKKTVIRAHREALDEAGFNNVPVICGASEQSVRLTIELCKEGAEAGAEYALIISPAYFRAAMDETRLYEYFTSVADASPLPIILYNYPGAVAGIDMDSDFIIKLSEHPNIVGTKFTCGNTGKLTRVAAAMDACSVDHEGSGYMAFGGMADFTAQTAMCGGSGIIGGGANVVPKLCVKVWNLWKQGKHEEAIKYQKILARSDWVLSKTAIPGTKMGIQLSNGYGGYPRRPLRRLSEDEIKDLQQRLAESMKIEKTL